MALPEERTIEIEVFSARFKVVLFDFEFGKCHRWLLASSFFQFFCSAIFQFVEVLRFNEVESVLRQFWVFHLVRISGSFAGHSTKVSSLAPMGKKRPVHYNGKLPPLQAEAVQALIDAGRQQKAIGPAKAVASSVNQLGQFQEEIMFLSKLNMAMQPLRLM
ncbi:Hypothetical predicted protein [Olea europaea subsp. europaea]|uniref:Uncharacterized protein n=1 Tax=Olea europaea subsp. europaea TaxID=158383 RepID=A0A8S0R2S0_OLEEU|nr:Hypothetical predicted protein [Olea europaea subsp. europaea]